MTARNYPLRPSNYQRRILAVLATARLTVSDPTYGGLLFEDIRDRLPNGKRDRSAVAAAMDALIDADYVALAGRKPAKGPLGAGMFQSYIITSKGLRVALGVLG